MKTTNKFLLTATALAVLTSTSAFASKGIDLIKTDDITVNMDGDLDLKMVNKATPTSSGTTIRSNWDDIDFSFAYKIDDHLTFLAGTDWSGEYESGDGLKVSDGDKISSTGAIYNKGNYMGFSYDNNKLMIGGQEISFDTFGVDHAEIAPADKSSGYHDAGSTWHNQSFVYRYSFDDAYISTTYAKADADTSIYDVYQVVGFAEVGDFELMAGIGNTQGVDDDDYKSTYGQLEAVYNYGNGQIGVNLAMEDDEDAFTSQGIDFDFTYKLTKKATLNLGTSFITQDIDDVSDNDDYNSMYAGVTYKFNSYVYLYTEIGRADGDLAEYGKTTFKDKSEKTGGMYLNFQY